MSAGCFPCRYQTSVSMTGMTARGRVPGAPKEGAQTYIALPCKTTRVARTSSISSGSGGAVLDLNMPRSSLVGGASVSLAVPSVASIASASFGPLFFCLVSPILRFQS